MEKHEPYSADFWSHLDQFLIRERDSTVGMLTHVRLAITAGVIIAVLCCVKAFLNPFIAFLEFREVSGSSSSLKVSQVLLVVVAIGALSLLLLILLALASLNKAFARALHTSLHRTAEAVEVPLKEADIEIPEKTAKLLETFK